MYSDPFLELCIYDVYYKFTRSIPVNDLDLESRLCRIWLSLTRKQSLDSDLQRILNDIMSSDGDSLMSVQNTFLKNMGTMTTNGILSIL